MDVDAGPALVMFVCTCLLSLLVLVWWLEPGNAPKGQ